MEEKILINAYSRKIVDMSDEERMIKFGTLKDCIKDKNVISGAKYVSTQELSRQLPECRCL